MPESKSGALPLGDTPSAKQSALTPAERPAFPMRECRNHQNSFALPLGDTPK
jgi:hypothetical protein